MLEILRLWLRMTILGLVLEILRLCLRMTILGLVLEILRLWLRMTGGGVLRRIGRVEYGSLAEMVRRGGVRPEVLVQVQRLPPPVFGMAPASFST